MQKVDKFGTSSDGEGMKCRVAEQIMDKTQLCSASWEERKEWRKVR